MLSRKQSLLVSGLIAAIVLAGTFAQAGTISFNYFTDDAGSGISHLKTYTHLYDGGQNVTTKLATVDGVAFNLLTHGNPGTHPWFIETSDGKFRCETFKPDGTSPTAVGYNSLDLATDHGITDTTQGVYNLMRDVLVPWAYNIKQIYTVRGLTPGTEYDLRLYYSKWKLNNERNITFNFDANGDGAFDILNGDDTTGVVNIDAGDGTYSTYLSYKYTAPSSGVMLVEIIHADTVKGFAPSGLSNEVAIPVPEPSTLALLAAGLFGLIAYAWRKRK